jgi:tetratricopeptide (TPR) repeat protein
MLRVGALSAVLASSVVRADTPPGAWDFARDPAERERWELHVAVERLLHQPVSDDASPFSDTRRSAELHLEQARQLLEEADAEHSPDVRLRFDLGIVYQQMGEVQARDDLHRRAVEVLAPAIDDAPDHPGTTAALERLVYAYARLDRPREELATWRRLIPRVTDDRSRLSDMMNMGEAEMRLGLVDDALGTFREVLRLCGKLANSSSTYVLTLWDLAVALDRAGDPGGAVAAAVDASPMIVISSTGAAMNGAEILRRDPAVFFVPEWEREWYLALASSAKARGAQDARAAASAWADAERHWDTYVARASAAGGRDRWLAIARIRRERVHRERLEAEKKAARQPRRALAGDE